MESSWHVYITDINGEGASVSVDTAAVEHEPKLKHLILLHLQAKTLRDNGFPSKDDFEQIYDLEEQAVQVAGQGLRHVGRATIGGTFRSYFYSAAPDVHVATIKRLAETAGLVVRLEYREDEDWRAYRERLYPSPEAWQQIKDRQVLQALQESGDDLSKPRQIDHWLYFSSVKARDAVTDRLMAKSFKVVDKTDPAAGGSQWGLRVSRVDSVQPHDITNLSVSLMHLAAEYGGEYDGWETSVEK